MELNIRTQDLAEGMEVLLRSHTGETAIVEHVKVDYMFTGEAAWVTVTLNNGHTTRVKANQRVTVYS